MANNLWHAFLHNTVVIYGLTRPVVKMYKVSALIEIDPEAKLDPLQKIKSMIEYGIFNEQVLNDLSSLQGISKPESIAFEVKIPEGLSILDVAYKTPNVELGKAVLNSLGKRLKKNYVREIKKINFDLDEAIKAKNESIEKIRHVKELMKKQFEVDVATIRGEINEHVVNIEALKEEIGLAKNRINQMEKMLKRAQTNSEKLVAKRMETTLNSQDQTGHTNVFLQASAIQQIINYPIVLREGIDSLIFEEKEFLTSILAMNNNIEGLEKEIEILKAKHDAEIKRLEKNIEISKAKHEFETRRTEEELLKLKSEIELMNRNVAQFTGISIRQPPTASLLHINTKIKRNVILAGAFGFFVSIFLGFLIEYIKNASTRIQKGT